MLTQENRMIKGNFMPSIMLKALLKQTQATNGFDYTVSETDGDYRVTRDLGNILADPFVFPNYIAITVGMIQSTLVTINIADHYHLGLWIILDKEHKHLATYAVVCKTKKGFGSKQVNYALIEYYPNSPKQDKYFNIVKGPNAGVDLETGVNLETSVELRELRETKYDLVTEYTLSEALDVKDIKESNYIKAIYNIILNTTPASYGPSN